MDREVALAFVTVASVLVPLFVVLSLSLIVYEFFGGYGGGKRSGSQRKPEKSSGQLLAELEEAGSSNGKAKIFVALILVGYVLNHIIGNEGEKYDDDKQRERFKRFLTPDAVKRINSMGGIDDDNHTLAV